MSQSNTPPHFEALHAGAVAQVSQYPVIKHIDDIKPHVSEGRGIHFFEDEKFIICRYVATMPETFQTIYDLECRCLIFDRASGDILSRTLHKPFNLGERQSLYDLDFSEPAHLSLKLDGSMIGAFFHEGNLHFHTRGGISQKALEAKSHATPNDIQTARLAIEDGYTPIFEYTSPDNRVVIPYEQSSLTLLTVRHIHTGAYNQALAERLCGQTGTSFAPTLISGLSSPAQVEAVMVDLQARNDIEGAMLCFPDGHRLKIKTFDYSHRHKILANIANEKYAYQAVIDGVVDDTSVALGGDRGKILLDFAAEVERSFIENAQWADQQAKELREFTPKERAKLVKERYQGTRQTLVFCALNGGSPLDQIKVLLHRKIGSPEKRADIKAELNLPDWYGSLENVC